MMSNLSKEYLLCFDFLDDLRKKRVHLSLSSPLDLPPTVARNHLRNKYGALRLSKTCVIVNSISSTECHPSPLPTIYLFGPDLMGEKEAVMESNIFMCFPQNWGGTNGQGWSNEYLGLNKERVPEIIKRYPRYDWLEEIATRIDQLATEEVIRLAYDFVFDRPKPEGSMRTIGLEAFSKTAINTILRNFLRANVNHLFRDGVRCTAEGSATIDEIENELNAGGFSNQDCLKIGPSNNLLTFQAIHILNMYGWKANVRSLSCLLACRYLRSKTELMVKRKLLRESSSSHQRRAIKDQIQSELEKKDKLEKFAFKFVRKSIKSLVKQEAIADIGNAYLALGDCIETPFGEIPMDPYQHNALYSSVLLNIREIHNLIAQKGVSRQRIGPPKQSIHHKPRIYIASTCYDFRDLRREVALALREWGYDPLLSEDSNFPVEVGVDSYQACVEAVKKSDCLVLIIGTRYGGEVEGRKVSITELEYQTACNTGIPRINFCLDLVWNLVQVRRRNPNIEYPRYFSESREKADKIFRFLDRVRKFEIGKTDNWVHPFKDSVELKEVLRKRLKKVKLKN